MYVMTLGSAGKVETSFSWANLEISSLQGSTLGTQYLTDNLNTLCLLPQRQKAKEKRN